MRPGLSPLAALLAVAIAGAPAIAQNLITLSPELVAAAMPDADKDKLQPDDKLFKDRLPDQGPNASVRPNAPAAGVYFVYALNADARNRTLIVSLRNATDGQSVGEGRAENVPARHWSLIRFAKPAPPAAPPAPAPAADPKAAPAEPPPPGVAVARGATGFALVAKLYDEDPKAPGVRREVLKGDKTPAEVELNVQFNPPAISPQADASKYPGTAVKMGDLSLTDGVASIPLTALPAAKTGSTARITFPGQPGGGPPLGVSGVFALTLDPTATNVPLGGKFPNGLVPMHVAIDGIERVRVYEPATGTDVKAVDKQRVRVIPVGRTASATTVYTKPTAAYAVRVETDNGVSTDTLQLELSGDATKQVIPLGGPRDERLWVDVAEPTKQGLGFATKTTDWVKAVDLTAARGKVTLKATLKGTATTTASLPLLIDADAPAVTALTVGDPTKASEKVVKGKPVRVKATVKDEDGSGVEKVAFVFFSRLQDDGTLPPDAVAVDAVRLPELDKDLKPTGRFVDEWAADVTVPADKKGRFFIAAVAADKAGNLTRVNRADAETQTLPPNVKELQLVDAGPPQPGGVPGSISGIVIFAGRPQPDLPVVVGGGDGKAKAVVFTNAAGKFCIPNVVPGVYTVLTAKSDTNKGFQSQADVTVEPEKTAKVSLELIRNK